MSLKSSLAIVAMGLAALTPACLAQTVPFSRNALTNRDVVVLAKAGFNEDFIIDTILDSRTQFNTTVDGLADLAKQGMTERLIRVMMTCADSKPAAGQDAAPVVAAIVPDIPPRARARSAGKKPSTVAMAISTRTPYYEWTSAFWGLWKKRIGVAAVVQQPVVPMHLGAMYQEIRAPRQYQVPAFQQHQAAPVYTVQAAPEEP